MKIGSKIYINGDRFLYTCVDTSMGEYAPDDVLISVKTGRVYKLPFSKSKKISQIIDEVRKKPSKLVDITQCGFSDTTESEFRESGKGEKRCEELRIKALKKFVNEFEKWKKLNSIEKHFEIAEMMDAYRMALEALE